MIITATKQICSNKQRGTLNYLDMILTEKIALRKMKEYEQGPENKPPNKKRPELNSSTTRE